jgi:hypothetical protein
MRLRVELSCVTGLSDEGQNTEDLKGEPRWSESIRQVVLQVDRPETGTVDLPMTCSCCGKKMTLRVRSKGAVQDLFIWILMGGGTGTFLFAVLLFATGVKGAFAAVLCLLIALAGLGAISTGIWLSLNRPAKFDSIPRAVRIAVDEKRDEEMRRVGGVYQHAILSVTRSDQAAP